MIDAENIQLTNAIPYKREKSIEVKDLVKIYNTGAIEVFALRGLNAVFYRGEIVIIEGSSGCGKSTFVNIIGGLDRQSAGDIYFYAPPEKMENDFFDQNQNRIAFSELKDNKLELFRQKKIGIIFQFMNLIPTLSARENVELPLLFQDIPEDEKKERSLSLLEQAKIQHRADHKPAQMSGGEQQRVAIAAALINNPEIIIADEPTGNLDSKTAQEMIELFKTIHETYKDKTIIIVSHDRSFRRIADRILFIKDGVIINEQTPKNLAFEKENLTPVVADEIQKYQHRIMELEQKLSRMEKIFKEAA